MISTEAMSRYRAAAAQRQAEQRQRIAERYQRAQQVAQEASDILKHEFGASKVVLFGSVLQLSQFHAHSDVDLAVWGLDERRYYRAVARLLDIEATIPVDVVDMAHAPARLQAIIHEMGVEQ